MQPFIFVNINNINIKSIFNLILEKYKEIYSYACECRKEAKEDVLCLKIKYNVESYPEFLFIVFNLTTEYKLVRIIIAQKRNHYNTIIFNPLGILNTNFSSNNIYYHDGMISEGRILQLKKGEDWKKIGIPYIALYKKLKV